VVVWDNRSTQHYALFDFSGQRVVERVHVSGGAMDAHRLEPDERDRVSATEGPW
jgi:hypothetical protein